MNKIIFLVIGMAICCLSGCKNDELLFDSKSNLYFVEDSMMFSWLRVQQEVDTVYLPCQLVGQAPTSPQKFSLEVLSSESDAVEGVHYEVLPEFFVWPANTFLYNIPIVIYNKDAKLVERFFRLKVKLVGNGELQVNYTGNTEYTLWMGAQVVKPLYWETYTMSAFFGEYSKKKHSIVVMLAGRDFPDTQKGYKAEMVFWQNFGIGELNTYFKNNVVKDENGKVIEPWI